MKYFVVLLGILLVCSFAGMATAQSDPFGQVDRIYGDSVVATPGQLVPVRFLLTNDELVSGFTLPLVYDTTLLQLKSVSFVGSRGEYIQTKIVTPNDPTQAAGHFLTAVIKFNESPIPAGDGLLFTANFAVSASAPIGTVARIDTLFFAPGGYVMLTENATAAAIRPIFKAGKIVVRQANRQPVFQPIPPQYVLEGDTLKLDISASDPDGDALSFASPSKPSSATFVSLGSGKARLTWVPDYIGPLSADGSPFTIMLWVSDGKASAEQEVQVQVVNRNRHPSITAPSSLQITAGDSLNVAVSATDPDFENVTWTVLGSPTGSKFENSNPAHLKWSAPLTDSGTMAMTFIASDPQGYSDTANVTVRVQSAILYTLAIDTPAVQIGDPAVVNVTLDNRLPVGSFNLLMHYDPTVMTLTSVSKVGTRADYFESYVVSQNASGIPGDLRIVGLASLSGASGAALPVGSGKIATLNFLTVSDLAYAGMSLPVKFVFQDVVTQNDNTLTTNSGVKIPTTDIQYSDGSVKIQEIGTIRVGDINLNGIAYEIGDAIYFTNYFVNPGTYRFNALQYANSDVNGDNLVGTISDLVRLIKIIVNGGTAKIGAVRDYQAQVTDEVKPDRTIISYRSECAVGGMTAIIQTTDVIDLTGITCADPGMTVLAAQDGSHIRVIVYSLQGAEMSSGLQTVLTIPGLQDYTIMALDLASSDGEPINITRKSVGLIPSNYRLEQNYPNPFNPSTRIEFSLPQAGNITLTIYDALGRTVRRLASGMTEAGQHAVVWNGSNEQGQAVSSGVYFYRLETANGSYSRKMVLLK